MRLPLIPAALLTTVPAAASPYPAANCLEVAKAGDIIEEQAGVIAAPAGIDVGLFEISNTDIRQWLLKRCYPDCEDMDAREGTSSLMELTESCGGKK